MTTRVDNLSERFQAAVQQFWTGRSDAQERQIVSGKVDAGTRGAVTAGGHMGAIEALVVDLLQEAGLDRLDVKTRTGIELPGYFRPEKKWDLLVVADGQLITVIEFKSQVGSIGKNFNNRVEEAVGNATDFWTAFREGQLGSLRPFIGYFFVLEDCQDAHAPRTRFREPYFEIDPAFQGLSYAQRYGLSCQRLILERLYDATCLTLATKSTATKVSHPVPEISFERFAAQLQGHAMGFAKPASF
jgi:hypothetical protein